MTRQEYEQQYLVVDNMTFTPRYDYNQIEVIENGKTMLVDDYTIIVTAAQVYQEWKEQPLIEKEINQIEALKTQISETDYQIIKCYEYSLVNKELPYDIELLHNERQTLRDEINQLESQEQGGVDDARNI